MEENQEEALDEATEVAEGMEVAEVASFDSESEVEIIFRPLEHTAFLGIPPTVRNPYFTYRPSEEIKTIRSEARRTVFVEHLIEEPKLGPLSELCVRAIAQADLSLHCTPLIYENPNMVRIYYESLPVNTDLDRALRIDHEIYWKRLVLEKTTDRGLAMRKDVNWRNQGVSLILVENVEAASVEYWRNEEMEELALKISEFVTELHLSKLKSQTERTLRGYYEDDHELWDVTSDSDEMSALGEENQGDSEKDLPKTADDERDIGVEDERSEGQSLSEATPREPTPEPPPPPPPPKKKKKKKKKPGVFDIEIPESSSELRRIEDDAEIIDHRNLDKLVEQKRSYTFPDKICHHIDLSFIRYFENIEIFTLQFDGAGMIFDFKEYHLKFSYRDMHNLALGLSFLRNLRIFRLRRSRMDARKLKILVRSLAELPNLETVDFGVDQLKHDCGRWLHHLVAHSTTLRFLELEDNQLSGNAMWRLGQSFARHQGSIVEYLGLARNPLCDRGLHNLVRGLIGTHHVTHLRLTGIKVSEAGIICCIANELLAEHTPLLRLDLEALVEMGVKGGNHVHDALIKNMKILEMDVRGCNLEYEVEFNIALLLKRNHFTANCPYLDNQNITVEEIEEIDMKIKDPTLLNVNEGIVNFEECCENRPPEFVFSMSSTESSVKSSESTTSGMELQMEIMQSSESSKQNSVEYPWADKTEPFLYNPEVFDEAQLMKFMYAPGPENRYHYFCKEHRRHDRIRKKTETIDNMFSVSKVNYD